MQPGRLVLQPLQLLVKRLQLRRPGVHLREEGPEVVRDTRHSLARQRVVPLAQLLQPLVELPAGEGGVEVMHFFELCSKILNEKVQYEKQDQDYYETVVQLTLEKAQASNMKYDAIDTALDPAAREVAVDGQKVELTTLEFDILEILIRGAGRVLSRDALMEALYNRKTTPFDRSIDMHISHLRSRRAQAQPR